MIAKVASSWKMALAVLLLLGLFWSLVCCQTFPYVSFMSQTLANHSYVDLSLVGRPDFGDGEGVQCTITDLGTCCHGADGPQRGDWSLMELDCLLLILMLIPLSFVVVRELTYVVTLMLTHQLLVSIAVIFQLMLSMVILTSQ